MMTSITLVNSHWPGVKITKSFLSRSRLLDLQSDSSRLKIAGMTSTMNTE
jgi:hypothetical protein